MKVLVAVASQHGSTQEIAYAIGKTIRKSGLEVNVKNIEDIPSLSGYQAVVLGSAVYAGSWLKSAREFVDKHGEELASIPTWLFSSGPIGRAPSSEKAIRPEKINEILAKTKASGHQLFGGKVDKAKLNFAQKAILYAVGASEGDFRDWKEIEAWAAGIAGVLKEEKISKGMKHHELVHYGLK